MLFRNNKNETIEQLGVHITDKKMHIIVRDEKQKKKYEGQIYDWQLPILLNLKYISIGSSEDYKINKAIFDVEGSNPDLNTIYIYAEAAEIY